MNLKMPCLLIMVTSRQAELISTETSENNKAWHRSLSFYDQGLGDEIS